MATTAATVLALDVVYLGQLGFLVSGPKLPGAGQDTTLDYQYLGEIVTPVRSGANPAILLAADIQCQSVLTGGLVTDMRIVATLIGTSTVAAALTTNITMLADMVGISTFRANIPADFVAAMVATSTFTVAPLSTNITMKAAPFARSVMTGALTTNIRMSALTQARGFLTGTLETDVKMFSDITCSSAINGNLKTSIDMQAVMSALSTVSASRLVVAFRRLVFKNGRLSEVFPQDEGTGLKPATLDNGIIVEDGAGPGLILKAGHIHAVTDEDLLE